ncbi:MAG: ABC transporter permease, partial [Deltaproteobacteria bacterium]|nr:ABC transporter permease [Deltaproteobacteria bacterium]
MTGGERQALDPSAAAGGGERFAPRERGRPLGGTTQERSVLAAAALLFLGCALVFDSFLTTANLLAIARSVAALGILSIAMAIVVIGRGIDLSLVATMGMAVTVTLHLLETTAGSYAPAVLAGLGLCAGMGALNGLLVAFVEIPALFATFATGLLVVGFTRTFIVKSYVIEVPKGLDLILYFGQGRAFGVPLPIVVFAVVALVAHVALSRTIFGWFLYAQGDNPAAARLTGIPVRPLTVLQFALAAMLAYLAGLVIVGTVGGFDSRIVQSALIFDVLTVVVVGGVSLAGGRGGVPSV